MPIDIERLKKKHGRDAKIQTKESEPPITKVAKPTIKKEGNIEPIKVFDQRYKEKLSKEILRKRRGVNNLTKQKSKPKLKKNSGLERTHNTKEQFDSLLGVNEARQHTPNTPSIDPLQFINRIVPMAQGNNNDLNQVKTMMEIFKMMQQQQQQPQHNRTDDSAIKLMGTMMGTMFQSLSEQNQNYLSLAIQQMRSSQGQPQEDPRKIMMDGFNLYKDMSGDNRARTKDEMDFDLRKKELELKEYSRRDMLDREERQVVREDAKSQRFMNIGETVLNKVIGDGLGNLMSDFMSLRGNKGDKGKQSSVPARKQFDPSLLDEEL